MGQGQGQGRGLFEIGGQWIDNVDGSANYYRFWYDRGAGELRRRSLKTTDFEEAKLKLAAIVGTGVTQDDAREPEKVMISAVLNHYFTQRTDKLPSADAARRAGVLVTNFLIDEAGFKPSVKVSVFTKGMQQKFAEWCAVEFDHSVAYISRNLSVIGAAFNFAASDVVIKTPEGELREVRLLRFAPDIYYDQTWLSEVTDQPESRPRDYVPTYEDLALLLDCPGSDMLRRYDLIALNTWARPTANLDIRVSKQVDFQHDLLDLNPPGRRQNKKRRPLIRLTRNLRAWFELWGDESPLNRPVVDKRTGKIKRVAITSLKMQFYLRAMYFMLRKSGLTDSEIRHLEQEKKQQRPEAYWAAIEKAEAAGIRRMSRYTYRHFMATKVRGLEEVRVDREQREMWLGHVESDTTSWYETHDPEYLRACADATDVIMEKLDALTTRPLVPDSLKARMQAAGIRVVKE